MTVTPSSINATVNGCNDSTSVTFTINNTGSSTLNYNVDDGYLYPIRHFDTAYVANQCGSSVGIINTQTFTSMGTIAVGTEPWRCQIKPDASEVWVSNRASNTVSVINTKTSTVLTTIAVGNRPTGIAFSSDGNFAYVCNRWDDNVYRISCSTYTVTDTLPSPCSPQDIVVHPNGQYAYVAGSWCGLAVLDLTGDSIYTTVNQWDNFHDLAIGSDGSYVYCNNLSTASVDFLNTTTNLVDNSINGFSWPHGIDVTNDGRFIYVANNDPPYDVFRIEVATGTVTMVNDPLSINNGEGWGLAVCSDGQHVIVTDPWNVNEVEFLDMPSNTITNAIFGGGCSMGVATLKDVNWMAQSPSSGTIGAGGSTNVTVWFYSNGLNAGTYQAYIYISGDDPANPMDSIPVTFTVNGVPGISVQVPCLDLDTVIAGGGINTGTTMIANTGCDTLFVTNITSSSTAFSVDTTNFFVSPGSSFPVQVSFGPASSGTYNANLTVYNNDVDTVICLTGFALPPPAISVSPLSLSAILSCNDSTILPLTVNNTGSGTLNFKDVSQTAAQSSWVFNEDFESGNLNGWTDLGGAYPHNISADAHSGNFGFRTIGGTNTYYDGIMHTFPVTQAGYIGFWIKGSASPTGSHGEMAFGDANTTFNGGLCDFWLSTAFGGSARVFTPVDGTQSVPVIPGQWHYIEFRNIDYTNKRFDWYVDGVLAYQFTAFWDNTMNALSEIHLFGWDQTDTCSWDDIVIGDDPGGQWLNSNPSSGAVIPSGNTVLNVGFNSTGLNSGTYYSDLAVYSDDPVNPVTLVPCTLTVAGSPALILSDTCLNFDTVLAFSNPTDTVCLTNTGCDTLLVTSVTNGLPEYTFQAIQMTSSRVSNTSDDAEEYVASGAVDIWSSDLELTWEFGTDEQLVGMRFNNINIPPGATITNAYIEFECDEATSGTTNVNFFGEANGNASAFTSTNFDISSRPLTTASTAWNNIGSWVVNGHYQTPDLSAVIQEIVNTPGWVAGNSLAVIAQGTGYRIAESYDGEAPNAPLLVVEYTSSSPIVLPGDGICYVVTFSPTVPGTFNDALNIQNNAGDTSVCLTGVAIPAPTISINPSSFNVSINSCCDSVLDSLTVYNTGGSPLIWNSCKDPNWSDDFDPGTDVSMWASNTGVATNICGSVSGNALRFANSGTRQATSIDMDVRCGGTVDFYLYIGTGGSCEYVDAGEEIVLEYSIDGGVTFTQMGFYPQINNPSFVFHSEPIPTAALTASTRFRWRQLSNSGSCCDHWAIDAVSVVSGSGSYGNYLVVNPGAGTIPPGDSTMVYLQWISCATNSGTYIDTLLFSSNDPLNPSVPVVSTFTIDGVPGLLLSDSCLNLDTILAYNTALDTVCMTNTGCDTLFVTNYTTTLPEYSVQSMQMVSSRVDATEDDAEEYVSDGSVDIWSTDLELTWELGTNEQLVGMRFNNINIAPGTTITNAYIEYECDEATSGTTNVNFFGEATGNALAFTSDTFNISSRPLTTASTAWNNITPWVVNSHYQTPDLSAVIQEIINNPGWASGNSLAIIAQGTGYRIAESFDGEAPNAPLLVIQYTAPTVAIPPGSATCFEVTFSPSSAGTFNDLLTIQNNAGDTSVCLTGVALPPPVQTHNPDSINITLNSCCDSTTIPLTIYNAGSSDLTFNIPGISNQNILILGGNSTNPGAVKTELLSTGLFSSSQISTMINPNPLTMSMLSPYDAVLVYTNSGFTAGSQIGDTLARFVDNGGGIVLATYAHNTWANVQGAIGQSPYSPVGVNINVCPSGVLNMASVTNPQHPIFSNITVNPTYWTNCNYGDGTLNPGGIVLATDTWGYNTVAENTNGSVVTILIYPENLYLANTESKRLFANALKYVNTSIPGLTLSQDTGTIVPGDSVVISVDYNSCGQIDGVYFDTLFIYSNDPLNPVDSLPVTVTLNGAPQIALSDTCLYLDSIMAYTTSMDSIMIYNNGCAPLNISDANNALAEFTLSDTSGVIPPYDSMMVYITFAPLAPGQYLDTVTILSNDIPIRFCLSAWAYAPPVISYNPSGFNFSTANCCDTLSDTLMILNTGGSPLIYTVLTDTTSGVYYDSTISVTYFVDGATTVHTYTGLPTALPFGDSLYLTITLNGDYNSSWESCDLFIDGTPLGTINDGNVASGTNVVVNYVFGGAQVNNWLSDGMITIQLINSSSVNYGWGLDLHRTRLRLRTPPSWLSYVIPTDTVLPGDSIPVAVQAVSCNMPNGTYSANIILNSNDPLNNGDTIAVSYTITGMPQIALSDTCLYLDTAVTYGVVTDSFKIFNLGCDTLFVTDINHNNSLFTLSDTSGYLAPFDSGTVTVTFTSTSSGTFQDTLLILNNDANMSICLNVVVIPRPIMTTTPDTIYAFLNGCCDSTTAQVTVYNTGGSDLIYSLGACGDPPLPIILSRFNAGYTTLTSLVPSIYYFTDGITGTNIFDGGNDMYDGGNYLNTNFLTAIPYADNTVVNSTAFGTNGAYFTKKQTGIFIMAADLDNVSTFYTSGNNGADGSGSVDVAVLNSSNSYCGRQFTGFVKRIYAAGDPSINHLMIVENDPNVVHTYSTDTNNDNDQLNNLNLTPSTRVYYLLFASSNGGYVNNTQIQAIMDAFLDMMYLGVSSTASWLTVNPTAGTVLPGDSAVLNLNINGCSLDSGIYTTQIQINGNDPLNLIDTVTIILTKDTLPPPPTATDTAICFGDPMLPLIASGAGDSLMWYSDPTLTTLVFVGDTFFSAQTAVGIYPYYVISMDSGCASLPDTAVLTINGPPGTLAVADTSVCFGQPVPDFIATGGTYVIWSDTLFNQLFVGDTFNTGQTAVGSYLYFIQDSVAGCSAGPVDSATLFIDSLPVTPIALDTAVCDGAPVPDLTATGAGDTWYSDPGLTTVVGTGNTYTTGVSGPGTYNYYVTQQPGICASQADTSTLTIIYTAPPANVSNDTFICAGDPIPSFSATGTNLTWYDDIGLTNIVALGNSFTPPVSAPGVYTYYVTDSIAPCESASVSVQLTITAIPSAPTASNINSCFGQPTPDLSATGTGTLLWYDDAGLTNLVFTGSPFATGQTAVGTYTYYVVDSVLGCTGPAATVTLDIVTSPAQPVSSDTTSCFGDPVPDLTATGTGNILWFSDPLLTNLVATGSPFSTGQSAAGVYTYYVSDSISGCKGPSDTVSLTINAQPAVPAVGDTAICFGMPTPDFVYNGTFTVWTDTSGNVLQNGDTLTTGQTASGSYTYLVTDSVAACPATTADTATLTIWALPVMPAGIDTGSCFGDPVPVLFVNGAVNDSIAWFSDSLLTTLVGTGDTLNTGMSAIGTYTYYVIEVDTATLCQGPADTVTLDISVPLSAAANDTSVCEGFPTPPLIAIFGSNITWYDTTMTVVATNDTFFPSDTIAGVYTYYVTQNPSGCESLSDTVLLTIYATPAQPSIPDTSICYGNAISPYVYSGGTVNWYDTLWTLVFTGDTFAPGDTAVGTYTYYVTDNVMGCAGPADTFNIYINPIPPTPTASDIVVCEGDSVPPFIASGGTNYHWYSDSLLSTEVFQGDTFYSGDSLAGVYTYYLTDSTGGCHGIPDTVFLTINPIPAAPVVSDTMVCYGDPVPALINGSAPDSTVWYSDPALTTWVFTGDTFNTGVSVAGTFTYYAVQWSLGCVGPADTVNLILDTIPQLWLSASCVNFDTVIEGTTGVDTLWLANTRCDTIAIDSIINMLPEYTVDTTNFMIGAGDSVGVIVSFAPSGSASFPDTLFIYAGNVPDTVVCLQGIGIGAPKLTIGTDTFNMNFGGCCDSLLAVTWLYNTGDTGAANLDVILSSDSSWVAIFPDTLSIPQGDSASVQFNVLGCMTPGYYTAYITLSSNDPGLPADTIMINVVKDSLPPIPVVNDLVLCYGDSVPPLIALSGDTVHWYSDAALTTEVYVGDTFFTNDSIAGVYTYWFTNVIDSCPSLPDSASITINSAPAAPMVSDTSLCSYDSIPPFIYNGTLVNWMDTSGTLVFSGDTFYTMQTIPGVYTYLVTDSTGACPVSIADTAILTIIAQPAAPVGLDSAICYGSGAPTLVAIGTNITWYDTAMNIVFTGDTFPTGDTALGTHPYYLSQTVNGCTSPYDTAVLTISINTPPLATDTAICYGDPVPLLTASGGNGIHWYKDVTQTVLVHIGDTFATGLSQVGIYNYYVTSYPAGCPESIADTATLNILPNPLIALNYYSAGVYSGDSVQLVAYNAATYNWTPASGLNTTTGSVVWASPTTTTTYTVTGTNSWGCSSDTSVVVWIRGTGIEPQEGNMPGIEETLIIFPNPSRGQFNISFESNKSEIVELQLMNTLSQQVRGKIIGAVKGRTYVQTFDITDLGPGVYYLRVTTEAGISNHRVIIE